MQKNENNKPNFERLKKGSLLSEAFQSIELDKYNYLQKQSLFYEAFVRTDKLIEDLYLSGVITFEQHEDFNNAAVLSYDVFVDWLNEVL